MPKSSCRCALCSTRFSEDGLTKLFKFPYLTENWNGQNRHLSFVSACVGLTTFSMAFYGVATCCIISHQHQFDK